MNNLYEKTFFNSKGCKINTNIVQINEADIEILKEFIMTQFQLLTIKDYFIIDDIDTELPEILRDSNSYMIGVVYNNSLIAIQALDFNERINKLFCSILKVNKQIGEMGWTLVDKDYYGFKISRYLIKKIEFFAVRSFDEKILISTVHPNNIPALKLYLSLGYYGVKLNNLFSLDRIICVKNTKYDLWHNKIIIETTNERQLSQYLNNNYVLIDIIKLDSKYFYVLVK